MLATNGIEMPVLGAFRLLGALAGARLPVTSTGAIPVASIVASSVRGAAADVDAMATLDGGKLQVLVWNYHDDIVTATPATVQVAVKVPASFGSSVSVTHVRMDDTHGDAYTVWKSQGSPQPPSAAQIQALQAAMLPQALGAPQTLPVTGWNGDADVLVAAVRGFAAHPFAAPRARSTRAPGAWTPAVMTAASGRPVGTVAAPRARAGRAARRASRAAPAGQAVPRGAPDGAGGAGQTGGGSGGPARSDRVAPPDAGAGGDRNAGPGGCSCDLADGGARPAVLLFFLLFLFFPPAGRGAPGPSPVGATLRTAQH